MINKLLSPILVLSMLIGLCPIDASAAGLLRPLAVVERAANSGATQGPSRDSADSSGSEFAGVFGLTTAVDPLWFIAGAAAGVGAQSLYRWYRGRAAEGAKANLKFVFKGIDDATQAALKDYFSGDIRYVVVDKITIRRDGNNLRFIFSMRDNRPSIEVRVRSALKRGELDINEITADISSRWDQESLPRREFLRKIGQALAAGAIGGVIASTARYAAAPAQGPLITGVYVNHSEVKGFLEARPFFAQAFDASEERKRKVIFVTEGGGFPFEMMKDINSRLKDVTRRDVFILNPDPEKLAMYKAAYVYQIKTSSSSYRKEMFLKYRHLVTNGPDAFQNALYTYLLYEKIGSIDEFYSETDISDPETMTEAHIKFETFMAVFNEVMNSYIDGYGDVEAALKLLKPAVKLLSESFLLRDPAYMKGLGALRQKYPGNDIIFFRGLAHSYTDIGGEGHDKGLVRMRVDETMDPLINIVAVAKDIQNGKLSLDDPRVELLMLKFILYNSFDAYMGGLPTSERARASKDLNELFDSLSRSDIEKLLSDMPAIISKSKKTRLPIHKAVLEWLYEHKPELKRFKGRFGLILLPVLFAPKTSAADPKAEPRRVPAADDGTREIMQGV